MLTWTKTSTAGLIPGTAKATVTGGVVEEVVEPIPVGTCGKVQAWVVVDVSDAFAADSARSRSSRA